MDAICPKHANMIGVASCKHCIIEQLSAELNTALDERIACGKVADQLRAENAELRKLLSDVRADLVARAEMDPDDGGAVLNISNGLLMRIDAAMKGQT